MFHCAYLEVVYTINLPAVHPNSTCTCAVHQNSISEQSTTSRYIKTPSTNVIYSLYVFVIVVFLIWINAIILSCLSRCFIAEVKYGVIPSLQMIYVHLSVLQCMYYCF